jgi:hypothetical protein
VQRALSSVFLGKNAAKAEQVFALVIVSPDVPLSMVGVAKEKIQSAYSCAKVHVKVEFDSTLFDELQAVLIVW